MRSENNDTRPKLLVTFLCFLTSAFIVPTLGHSFETEINIDEEFSALEYRNVIFENCVLGYSRIFEPNEINGQLTEIRWLVDLTTIDLADETEFLLFGSGDNQFHAVRYLLTDQALLDFVVVRQFEVYVKQKYPEAGWPYLSARSFDEYRTMIEANLQQRKDSLFPENRTIVVSSEGSATSFNSEIVFSHPTRIGVERFDEVIRTLISKQNC